MRGIGITEALRGLPDILVPVFALLTQLGDVWFVFTVLGIVYALGDSLPRITVGRERIAFVLALALGGLALTTGLKTIFGLPRPPAPDSVAGLRYVPGVLRDAYVGAATANGYGFPSGHALLSTIFWVGLAAVSEIGSRRRRAVAAGIAVIIVCLARLVLGVHYAVDVVAGVAIGLCYLAIMAWLARGRTRIAFFVAAVLAIASTFVGPLTFDDALTIGASCGAFVAWELLEDQISSCRITRRTGFLVTVAGFIVLGGVFGVTYALEPSFVVAGIGGAVVFAGLLSLPLFADRFEPSPTDRYR